MPPTWLSPYAEVWRTHYGGEPPWGQLGKVMKVVVAAIGERQALLAWENFCTKTPAQYVSIPKFAQTFGAWCPSSVREEPIPGSVVVSQILNEGLPLMRTVPKQFASREAAARWIEDYRTWLKASA